MKKARSFNGANSMVSLLCGIVFALAGLLIPGSKIYFLYSSSATLDEFQKLVIITSQIPWEGFFYLSLPYLTALIILETLSAVCFRIYNNNKNAVNYFSNMIVANEAYLASFMMALHMNDDSRLYEINNKFLEMYQANPLNYRYKDKQAIQNFIHKFSDITVEKIRSNRKSGNV